MVAPFMKFYGKTWVGFCLNTGKRFFLRGYILKSTETAQVLLKSGTRDFPNSSPFERLACFHVTISGNFEYFQYFNLETNFLENENLFQKTKSTVFQLETLRLKTHHFHIKVSNQKPMLRRIKWLIQITKKGVLPVTALFFSKFFFSVRTSCKGLI